MKKFKFLKSIKTDYCLEIEAESLEEAIRLSETEEWEQEDKPYVSEKICYECDEDGDMIGEQIEL